MVRNCLRRYALPLLLLSFFLLSSCAKNVASAPEEVRAEHAPETGVSLSWSFSDDADFFRVYRIEGTETDYRFLADVTDTSYTDTTPLPGKIYGYKVTAFRGNNESEGALSERLLIAENTSASAVTAPSAPVITSITKLDKYTAVIMFEQTSAECTYKIMRSKTKNGKYTLIGQTRESVYYDTSLSNGESFYYTVTAQNSAVSSAASAPAQTGFNAKRVFGVPVIMYHQFLTPEDVAAGINFGEYAIWKDDFEKDLLWLYKNGYTTITTKELMSYMNGEAQPPEKPIILTIDDGWRGVYTNALPLLEKYDMKAVFSVIGDRIDEATSDAAKSPSSPRLYCTWEELRAAEATGHLEMISHTATCHNDEEAKKPRRGANCAIGESAESFALAAIPDYSAMNKSFLNYFGFSPYAMSYPYSSRSVTSDEVWMQCGYRILYAGNSEDARKSATNYFAVGAGITRDSAVLRRIARMHGTSLEEYMRNLF